MNNIQTNYTQCQLTTAKKRKEYTDTGIKIACHRQVESNKLT